MTETEQHNADLAAGMHAAISARGYAIVSGTTSVRHASRGIVKGWGGYNHPRPLCQGHTSRVYFGLSADQTVPVTCKRCLASLA
jgi:hypothetical protein